MEKDYLLINMYTKSFMTDIFSGESKEVTIFQIILKYHQSRTLLIDGILIRLNKKHIFTLTRVTFIQVI